MDDDDLLASFASDAFSLESNRDRELMLMASFLQGALPHSSSPPENHHAAAGSNAQWIGGGPAISGALPSSSAGWNGWRPDASTSNGMGGSSNHYGSYPAPPPAPSSSFAKESHAAFNSNNAGPSSADFGFGQPTATPHGTPMSFAHPSLPPASPDLSSFPSSHSGPDPRYGTRSTTRNNPPPPQQQLNTTFAGCRAPAVSRERIPFGRRTSGLAGLPTAYEGHGAVVKDDEDMGMECEGEETMKEGYGGGAGDRYAYGNGWGGS